MKNMKKTQWIMIILALFLAFVAPLMINSEITIQDQQATKDLNSDLSASCTAAVKTAKDDAVGKFLYRSEDARKNAVAAFFRNFSSCISVDDNTDMYYVARYYVPCIAMVDYDGYYIMYAKSYQDGSGKYKYADLITPKQSWTQTYGDYIITYSLNDNVHVDMQSCADRYSGNYKNVYQSIAKDHNIDAIKFMADEDTFTEEKNTTVISLLNEKISYYIETHNSFHNTAGLHYDFVMPQTDKDYEAKMLEKPCFLAFSQGQQTPAGTNYVNIYAIANTEIKDDTIYYMETDADGMLYYHKKDCTYKSDVKNLKNGTMDECAASGADPCPYCVR